MYRFTRITPLSSLPRTLTLARPLSTTRALLAGTSTEKSHGSSTQGHTADKSHGLDVQNANANAGQNARANADSQPGKGGEGNEAFDAARQGGETGSAKQAEGTGPFKDQIGGQDLPGQGATKGSSEDAQSGGSMTNTIKGSLGMKSKFHTSARAFANPGSSPSSADAKGSREPKTSTQGEQNSHLKHKSASEPDSGKGNASSDPHLPSQSKSNTSSSSFAQKTPSKKMHTSAVLSVRNPDPPAKAEDYPGSRGPAEEHEPAVPGEKPKKARGDKTSQSKPRTDKPFKGKETEGDAGTGTAQPRPSGGGAASKVSERGMGKRSYSTTPPPGGYARAKTGEPNQAGYDAPAEALPPNLQSSYENVDPSAVDRNTDGLKTALHTGHSSSAVDPPNEALRAAAKDGSLPERNGPPEPEFGRIGLDDAWKNRKV